MEQTALHWVTIGRGGLKPGDRVSAEAGGLPIYRVLVVQDHRVWLKEERTGRDHVAPADALRWRLEA
jgi:hypothetical protein